MCLASAWSSLNWRCLKGMSIVSCILVYVDVPGLDLEFPELALLEGNELGVLFTSTYTWMCLASARSSLNWRCLKGMSLVSCILVYLDVPRLGLELPELALLEGNELGVKLLRRVTIQARQRHIHPTLFHHSNKNLTNF